jgi:hypothetical protein
MIVCSSQITQTVGNGNNALVDYSQRKLAIPGKPGQKIMTTKLPPVD